MTNLEKRLSKNSMGKFQAVILCLLIALSFLTICDAKDLTPPYLVDPIPAPGSVTNNWYFIRTGILDDVSGVNTDPDLITVNINGAPPRVKPIIEQSFEEMGCYVTVILSSSDRRETIDIEVQAYDLASEPNLMKEEWSFFVDSVSQEMIPVTTYPENYRNLDHTSESGNLRFSWAAMSDYSHYRIEFILQDGSTGIMDMSASSLESSYNLVSFVAEDISIVDWAAMAGIGQLGWRVAPITGPQGMLLTDYSRTTYVTYVRETLPILKKPYHNALLDTIHPPTFEWKPLNSPTDGSVAVFVKLDESGNYTNEFIVEEIPFFVSKISMEQERWDTFSSGNWAWTVLGKQPDGGFSEFMIQRFRKE